MNNTIPFRVKALKVDSFTIYKNEYESSRSIEVLTDFEFGVNMANHIVVARISYRYVQDDKELLQMTLSSAFDVEPAAFQSMTKDGDFVLEPYFSQYLCTINVGAARGELHARCEQCGSSLTDVVLPPINLVEALHSSIALHI